MYLLYEIMLEMYKHNMTEVGFVTLFMNVNIHYVTQFMFLTNYSIEGNKMGRDDIEARSSSRSRCLRGIHGRIWNIFIYEMTRFQLCGKRWVIHCNGQVYDPSISYRGCQDVS